MRVGEDGRLVGHEAGETVAVEGRTVGHANRMAGRGHECAGIPRGGSVDVADEAADVARRGAGCNIEIEQAGTAIGAAEEAAVRGSVRATAHASNGLGASGHGRCGGSGHHGEWCLLLSARPDRGMSDRLRLMLMSLRAGPGAWFGRSNRVVASDGLLTEYRPPVRFRQMSDGPGAQLENRRRHRSARSRRLRHLRCRCQLPRCWRRRRVTVLLAHGACGRLPRCALPVFSAAVFSTAC